MAEKDFTPRELEIMANAWGCMTEEPKVDYNKLAEALNMSNPRSASNAWALIKKKIIAKAGITKATDGEGGEGTPKATPKATPKRKKNAKADADDEESPSKKPKAEPKGGKGKKAEVKTEEEETAQETVENGDGDGEDGASSVKKEEGEDETEEDAAAQ